MSLAAAELLIDKAHKADFNEADTRFHLIDSLLMDILGWPRGAFNNEPSTLAGYSDYHLLRPNGKIALIIEAKRTGIYFTLPANYNFDKPYRSVKTKTLLTSETLKAAIMQAQRYCADEGCEFAAVSNGIQLILFKAFEKNRKWRDLTAIVISDIAWFQSHFSEAVALLGYSSVVERWSLREAFDKSHPDFREMFYPKEKISSYNQIINANGLAHVIRSTVQKYFGPLDIDDPEFVENCYVNQRAHDKSLAGIRNLINDSVSPFMQSYGISETEDAGTGGAFTNRLVKGVKQSIAGDVVVLFGGKGSGKSTFIK